MATQSTRHYHPLRQYRLAKSLSQAELAARIGVHTITVTRWELGTRQIDAEQVAKIARVTGIPPALLRPDLAKVFG